MNSYIYERRGRLKLLCSFEKVFYTLKNTFDETIMVPEMHLIIGSMNGSASTDDIPRLPTTESVSLSLTIIEAQTYIVNGYHSSSYGAFALLLRNIWEPTIHCCDLVTVMTKDSQQTTANKSQNGPAFDLPQAVAISPLWARWAHVRYYAELECSYNIH